MPFVARRGCVILLVFLSCGAFVAINRMYLSDGVFGLSFNTDSGLPYVMQGGLRGTGKESPTPPQPLTPVTPTEARPVLQSPVDAAAGDNNSVAGPKHVTERPAGNDRSVENEGERRNPGKPDKWFDKSGVAHDYRVFHVDDEPWELCANSDENCQCMGFVRYAGYRTRASYGITLCSPSLFLSPIQGGQCECQHVQLIRPDGRCGLGVPPRPDGDTWECDQSGKTPCCDKFACRAPSTTACACEDCVDWRSRVFAKRTWAGEERRAGARKHGTRVALVVPFRDQEEQLTAFKEHFSWFVKHGAPTDGNVTLEVFVVEQFDEASFNQGWLFNVGFLLAQKAHKAPFDCIVVHDVNMLPLEGVDYGDCATPVQLSSEMDDSLTGVPSIRDVSGIVSMSPAHWLQINGFSTTYEGWGSEDDLFLRLESAKLLFGNGCYPWCSGRGDTRTRRSGYSIRRPMFGHGRIKMTAGSEHRHVISLRAKSKNARHLANERTKAVGNAKKFLAEADGIRNAQVELVHVAVTEVGGVQYSYARVRAERSSKEDKKPMNISAVMVRGPGCEFALDVAYDLLNEAALQAKITKACKVGAAGSQRIQVALTHVPTKVAKLLGEVNVTTFVRHLARGADGVIRIHDSSGDGDVDEADGDGDSVVDDLMMEMEEGGSRGNAKQNDGSIGDIATTEEDVIKGTWSVPTQFVLCKGDADTHRKSGGSAIFKWDQLPNVEDCTELGFKQMDILYGFLTPPASGSGNDEEIPEVVKLCIYEKTISRMVASQIHWNCELEDVKNGWQLKHTLFVPAGGEWCMPKFAALEHIFQRKQILKRKPCDADAVTFGQPSLRRPMSGVVHLVEDSPCGGFFLCPYVTALINKEDARSSAAGMTKNAKWQLCAEETPFWQRPQKPSLCLCGSFVRYGVGKAWTMPMESAGGVVECSNDVFGDPHPGVAKRCECLDESAPDVEPEEPKEKRAPAVPEEPKKKSVPAAWALEKGSHEARPPRTPKTAAKAKEEKKGDPIDWGRYRPVVTQVTNWTVCSGESDVCRCQGVVRYGWADAWTRNRTVNGSVQCTFKVLGDPCPEKAKMCFCVGQLTTFTLKQQHIHAGYPTTDQRARWRNDLRCGPGVLPLPDGMAAECDPHSATPCCAPFGQCVGNPSHCACRWCTDWRKRTPYNKLTTPKDHYSTITHASHLPRRLALVIPFRDRESHLAEFRSHFVNFTDTEALPGGVSSWDVFIVEQFNSRLFQRGWLFNVGFTLATREQYGYSTNVKADCIGVQDIDELPLKNVDLGDCDTPVQWASEMQRFGNRVPYLGFAGGNVIMTPNHWEQINGFNNLYEGWGAEDDELFLRLQQKKLLFGNCYPFCTGVEDKHINTTQVSLRRPPRGYGGTSSELDKEGHTTRVTNYAAYIHNVKLLGVAEARKKQKKPIGALSGLHNVHFSVAGSVDFADGKVRYHHVRVRHDVFPMKSLRVALPNKICGKWIAAPLASTWPTLRTLETEARTLGQRSCPGLPGNQHLRWFGVSLETALGKRVESDRDLVVFVRSLKSATDGVFVLDVGQKDGAVQWYPPSAFSICMSRPKKFARKKDDPPPPAHHPRETIFAGKDHCKRNPDWTQRGNFQAYTNVPAKLKTKLAQTQSLCVGSSRSTCGIGQRMYVNSTCRGKEWQGLNWDEKRIIVGMQNTDKGIFCVTETEVAGDRYTRISPKCHQMEGTKIMAFSSISDKTPEFPSDKAQTFLVLEQFVWIEEDKSCAPSWICPDNEHIALNKRR
eukprot:GEMP01000711.1.p1 GENE.GEMP01000711.1~~GEMP01000711.1.p1  ORF type:complete len:1758 (+),score=421.47 GEMP01000711.1:143-5416(+)